MFVATVSPLPDFTVGPFCLVDTGAVDRSYSNVSVAPSWDAPGGSMPVIFGSAGLRGLCSIQENAIKGRALDVEQVQKSGVAFVSEPQPFSSPTSHGLSAPIRSFPFLD